MSFEKPSINDRGVTELPDANSSSSTPPTEDSTTIDIKPTITESPSPEAPKLPHDYGIGPVPGKPDACTGGIARENRGNACRLITIIGYDRTFCNYCLLAPGTEYD